MSPSRVVFDLRRDASPKISFLLPAYNERASLASVIHRLRELPVSKEIIVVDDGSTDGTRELLTPELGEGVAVVFHDRNHGKGEAVRTALGHARGVYAAIQDADLEYDPIQYIDLVKALETAGWDVVYGSRFLRRNPRIYWRFYLGNKALTLFINLLSGGRFTDSYTCYKLMKRSVFQGLDLASRGFEIEAEISVKVAMRGFRHGECPIEYRPRRVEEGKKINARDAWKGVAAAFKFWRAERKRGAGA